MKFSKQSDIEIWTKFKSGDNDALSFIYTENSPKLFLYGSKLTNNHSIVEDSIQELFSDLIRNRKNLGSTDNIQFYLIKSFKRRLLREIQYGKRSNLAGENVELAFEITYSIEHTIILDEISNQKIHYLKEALNQLTPRQKEAIYLRFTEGLEYEQIAEIMDMGIEGSRNLIYRAIKSLKDALQGKSTMLLFFLRNLF